MAERTGLEPATSGVTGQHSNRLNYRSALLLPSSVLKHTKSISNFVRWLVGYRLKVGVPTGIRTPVATVKG
jgi:hypothetical protein